MCASVCACFGYVCVGVCVCVYVYACLCVCMCSLVDSRGAPVSDPRRAAPINTCQISFLDPITHKRKRNLNKTCIVDQFILKCNKNSQIFRLDLPTSLKGSRSVLNYTLSAYFVCVCVYVCVRVSVCVCVCVQTAQLRHVKSDHTHCMSKVTTHICLIYINLNLYSAPQPEDGDLCCNAAHPRYVISSPHLHIHPLVHTYTSTHTHTHTHTHAQSF